MAEPKAQNLDLVSNEQLTSEGIRIRGTNGDMLAHDGVSEILVSGGRQLTTDQQNALDSVPTTPNAGNPLVTMDDLPPPFMGGGGIGADIASAPDCQQIALLGINSSGIFAGLPTREEMQAAGQKLVAYWDGVMTPLQKTANAALQAKAFLSCDGANVLRLNRQAGALSGLIPYFLAMDGGLGQRRSLVGTNASGYFILHTVNADYTKNTRFLLNADSLTPEGDIGEFSYAQYSSEYGTLNQLPVLGESCTGTNNGGRDSGAIPTGEFTISIWFKRTQDYTLSGGISNFITLAEVLSDIPGDTDIPPNFVANDLTLKVGFSPSATNKNRLFFQTGANNMFSGQEVATILNQWHNLVITFNDVTGLAKWYFDSVFQNSYNYAAAVDHQAQSLQLAAGEPYRGFVGEIYAIIPPGLAPTAYNASGPLDNVPLLHFTGLGYWLKEMTQDHVDAVYGNGTSYHFQRSSIWLSMMCNRPNWPGR